MTGGDLTRRFAEIVARSDPEIPLDEAALLIAAHGDPAVDVDAELRRLDDVAAACPERTFGALRRYLFDDVGLTGNVEEYGDPRNSYLHEVLNRKLGIPISLSTVMIEVGRRLGVPLAGVGMPGHFLVRHLADPPTFVDAFGGGVLLDEAGCEAIFRRLGGSGPWVPSYLDPVGPRAIVTRMLVNLQSLFLPRDLTSAAWVLRLRLTVPGLPAAERLGIARVLGSLGQFGIAAGELEAVADSVAGDEADRLRTEARALRARSN